MDTRQIPNTLNLAPGAQTTSLPALAAEVGAPSPPAARSNLTAGAAATEPPTAEITPAAADDVITTPAATPGLIGSAAVLAQLRHPGEPYDPDAGVASLTLANKALLADSIGGEAILQALASQLAVLESLFLRYVLNAEQADTPEQAAPLMKLALAAQAAWVRAASVLVMAKSGARVLPR